MVQAKILTGAEEFRLGDGPIGALVIHGYTSSPQVVRPIAEYLAERGVTALGPRLPGHGTTWQDLNTCNERQWIETVEQNFDRLASERDDVFVIGFSFGAALAIDLVARRHERVAGLVTLASFLQSKDPRRFLAPLFRRLVKSLPGVGNDTADPAAERELVYDRLPTSATHCMLRFVNRARRALPRIEVPTLVLHGRNDHTALPFNAELVYNSIGARDKELVWLDRSYHVLPFDHDRAEVFERIDRFIKQHARTGHARG